MRTECTTDRFLFQPLRRRDVVGAFDGGTISSDAGGLLLREVEQRTGGTKKVRNGVLKDGTGEIALVLWGAEVDLVAEGDEVRIVEGWIKDYKGRPQVSLGRTGKVEKR